MLLYLPTCHCKIFSQGEGERGYAEGQTHRAHHVPNTDESDLRARERVLGWIGSEEAGGGHLDCTGGFGGCGVV